MATVDVDFILPLGAHEVQGMFLDEQFYSLLAQVEGATTTSLEINREQASWGRRLHFGFLTLHLTDVVTWQSEQVADLSCSVSAAAMTGSLHGVLRVTALAAPEGQQSCRAEVVGDYAVEMPRHLSSFGGQAERWLRDAIALRGRAGQMWAASR